MYTFCAMPVGGFSQLHSLNGGENMNQQEHAGAYRAAIEAAMDELDFICQESERLRNRQYQFEKVVEVMKPLIGVSDSIEADESTLQPTEIARPQLVFEKQSESADPVQHRIDSVLGLVFA
jgi:hypothetical protein